MSSRTQADEPVSLARAGCILGLLTAGAILLYGIDLMLSGGKDNVYNIAVMAIGLLQALTCVYALQGSRPAWSFALSLNVTMTIVFAFGAAKVEDQVRHIESISDALGSWTLVVGFIPALAFGSVTALLALSSDEY